MLRLIMRRGPTPGIVYDLESDEVSIGRGNKNSIVIRDNEVSRDHCRLVRFSESYEIHDLNSSNGTFVNGQRVASPWLLQPGALIELGDTITLEFELASAEEYPAAIPNTLSVVPAGSDSLHYSVVMLRGPNVGQVFALSGDCFTLGRDLDNQVIIQDPEVSRNHLRFSVIEGGYRVEDLNTTNGTFVNGERLIGTLDLAPDDLIRLGTMVQLQYVVSQTALDPDADTTPRMPAENGDKYETTLHDFLSVEVPHNGVSARATGLDPGSLRDHLLIVYARENWGTIVAPLLVRLQDTRLNAWVDQYLTLGSDNWRAALDQALEECWLMVLVVSPEALHADHVRLIYRHFLSEGKPVIPLLINPATTMPTELARLRSIIYDTKNTQRSFHKLIFEIMQLRQQLQQQP